MARDLEFITKSLRDVLERGHGIVPVPHADLRLLIAAAEQRTQLHDALNGLLSYADEGCPEGGYIAVIEARAALKGIALAGQ